MICVFGLFLRRLRGDLNAKTRRLRCFGHVVNLAAKAFLLGKEGVGNSSEESDSEDVDPPQQLLEKDLESWKKSGPLGKLQKVVRYIRGSPQRMDAFMELLTSEKRQKVSMKTS